MFRIKFPTKKSLSALCLSLPPPPPPGVELGGSKDWYGWNIIMYKNSKLYSLYSWMLWKIPIIWKKALSKSCLGLNSLQKIHWTHTFISTSKWSWGLERLACLKYSMYQLTLNPKNVKFSLKLSKIFLKNCVNFS